jgi:DNA-binding CsgD family transcriptional regulator
MKLRQNQLVTDSDTWTVAERERMPFFSELYFPHGLEEDLAGCAKTGMDGSVNILLSTHFAHREEALRQESIARLKMLLPHVRRACEAEERLARLQREKGALMEALGLVEEAVAMLDRSGRVVQINRAAEELLRRSAGLRIAPDRRLILASQDARASLAKALAMCSYPVEMTVSNQDPAARIPMAREGRSPLILTVHAISRAHSGAFGAIALLFVSDPDTVAHESRSTLRPAFGLTPAEVRLARALCNGETLKAFSERQGVAYETARSQLRRIFDKTGARRQSDLIRLILRMP